MANKNGQYNTNSPCPAPSGFYAQEQVTAVTSVSVVPLQQQIQFFPSNGQQQHLHQVGWQQYHQQGIPTRISDFAYGSNRIYETHPITSYSNCPPSHSQIPFQNQRMSPNPFPPQYSQHQYQHHYVTSYSPQHPLPPPPPPPQSKSSKQEYRCQPCDMILDSPKAYEAHTSTHITCDKCSFTAVPKVVKGHFAAVHGQYSGNGFKSVTIVVPGSKKVQRFQICVGNHPDDIARWISERRKRFPRQLTNQQQQDQPKSSITSTASFNSSTPMQHTPKKESSVFSTLLEGYGSSDDNNDDDMNDNDNIETGKATTYTVEADDSKIESRLPNDGVIDEIDDPPSTTIRTRNEILDVDQSHTKQQRTRLCRYYLKNGQCRNGDRCKFIHQRTEKDDCEPNEVNLQESKRQRISNQSNGRAPVQRPPKAPTSLLHKLLANDMHREASLTLQLLEYIVQSNFLQNASTTNC